MSEVHLVVLRVLEKYRVQLSILYGQDALAKDLVDAVTPLIEQRAFSEFADRIERLPTAGSEPTAAFISLIRDQARASVQPNTREGK